MTCDAHMRPFMNTVTLDCEITEPHHEHRSILRDYAYPGSSTVISWFETDRRNFHGEYPGPCEFGCILPNHHARSCVNP